MYLKEVQGLRVVAAVMVAVYHIWFQRVSGGVDAFFVIAGFFLFRTLFKTGAPDGQKVLTYFQRTLARVLPSASLVIVATCAMFYAVDVDSIWTAQIKSAIAAILFVENWWLASETTNYLARDEVPSPFQQMWALSVQMQMYVILPVVLLVVGKLAGGRIATVGWIMAALFVLTFIYALFETARNQPFAYFNTGARIWEFLAGALLAHALPHLVLSRRMARVTGVAALMILISFAAVLPVGSLFPGLAALIPVLATCAIIIGAANGAAIGILNAPVMQTLGNISFTFYLWHWPLLILYWQLVGTYDTGFLPGLGIILVAGLLAYLTYAFAERPFRRSKIATGTAMISLPASLALMVPAVAAAGLWSLAYFTARDAAREDVMAFKRGHEVAADFVPATVIAKSDVPRVYDMDCVQRGRRDEIIECVLGNPEGDRVVALVGGSHSAQWQPALDVVAKRMPDLKILTLLKGNCPLSVSKDTLDLSDDCLSWGRKVIDRIQEMEPDVVVTLLTTTRLSAARGGDFVPRGFREVWENLKGLPILAIRDNPRGEQDILNCVDRLGPDRMACGLVEAKMLTLDRDPAPDLPEHVKVLDLSHRFCDNGMCPPVIDGVLVYRDASHITATFAHILADDFLAAFVNMGVLDTP